jgi:hypothetical protein
MDCELLNLWNYAEMLAELCEKAPHVPRRVKALLILACETENGRPDRKALRAAIKAFHAMPPEAQREVLGGWEPHWPRPEVSEVKTFRGPRRDIARTLTIEPMPGLERCCIQQEYDFAEGAGRPVIVRIEEGTPLEYVRTALSMAYNAISKRWDEAMKLRPYPQQPGDPEDDALIDVEERRERELVA